MPSYRPDNFAKIRCSYGPLAALLLLWAPLLPACSPEIGDACSTALDCSASGTRLCDQTQKGGYCTLVGCEEDTCPPESICVQFGRLIDDVPVARLSRTYCMYKCDKASDCRNDDGYTCFKDKEFGATKEARVLGDRSQKFCAPIAPKSDNPKDMMSMPDSGMSMPDEDAGTPETDAAIDMPAADAAMNDAAMSMPDAGN